MTEIDAANKSICSRSSRPEVLGEKLAVEYFAKFTGKRLHSRIFKNKFRGSAPATLF